MPVSYEYKNHLFSMQFSLCWSVKKDGKAFKKHSMWIVYYIASHIMNTLLFPETCSLLISYAAFVSDQVNNIWLQKMMFATLVKHFYSLSHTLRKKKKKGTKAVSGALPFQKEPF